MKFKHSRIMTWSALFLLSVVLYACIKSDNSIKGDSKIKFYNTVSGLSQDFYLGKNRLAIGLLYGSSSEYIVVEGDKLYDILAKNTGKKVVSDSVQKILEIGNHYSVFYTKNAAKDSMLLVFKDTLTLDTAKTRIKIINLGYTLGSSVLITDSLNTFSETLSYGQQSKYFFIKPGLTATIKFKLNLSDSIRIDRIPATSFIKNKAYTIVIDGSKGGKLQERLVPNN